MVDFFIHHWTLKFVKPPETEPRLHAFEVVAVLDDPLGKGDMTERDFGVTRIETRGDHEVMKRMGVGSIALDLVTGAGTQTTLVDVDGGKHATIDGSGASDWNTLSIVAGSIMSMTSMSLGLSQGSTAT